MAHNVCPCCDSVGGEESIYCDLCLAEKRAEEFREAQRFGTEIKANCVITRATRLDTDCEVELLWLA
jgi:hypothetical protein